MSLADSGGGLTRRHFLAAAPATAWWLALGLGGRSAWGVPLPRPTPDERETWTLILEASGAEESPAQTDLLCALVLHFRDHLGLRDILDPDAARRIPKMRSAVGVCAYLVQHASGPGLGHFALRRAKTRAAVQLAFSTSFASVSDDALRPIARRMKDLMPAHGPAVALRLKGKLEAWRAQYQRYLGQRQAYVLRYGVPERVLRIRLFGLRRRIFKARLVLLWVALTLGRRLANDRRFDAAAAFGRYPIRPSTMRGLYRASQQPLDFGPAFVAR